MHLRATWQDRKRTATINVTTVIQLGGLAVCEFTGVEEGIQREKRVSSLKIVYIEKDKERERDKSNIALSLKSL